MNTPVVAVILAAGKGTRMRSSRAKALFPLCGKPLAFYPIHAARQAGITRVVMVVGHQADKVREVVGDGVEYALQQPQHGTGHAVMCAEEALRGFTGAVWVHNVDTPLIPPELIAEHLRTHLEQQNAATLLTVHAKYPGSYGRILRSPSGHVTRIVEYRDATPDEQAIDEVNVGSYVFSAPLLFDMLRELTPNNDQGEYYLTDVVERLNTRGERVGAVVAPNEEMTAGINDRAQLAESEAVLRADIRSRHMRNGVTLLDPASTFIDEEVEIGQDTTIHPFTIIGAGTHIGSDCVIGPSTQLYGAILEDHVEVLSSRIELSTVRTGARVGPFARLRAGCDIGPGAAIGNYSELKNTRVGARSRVHHVGYLGDTTLGENVNIGAGTITCNFDGVSKYPTTIGDDAFIGSGNLIVAPIEIGDGALTGAGSVVTHDVPAGKIAYGVPARVMRDRKME